MSESKKPPFWSMAAAEPFRIFFPLGVVVGISGISLWPLYFLGIHHSFYPGVMHARMMIEGFMGAFILGFLGTAVPRLTGAAPFSRRELFTLLLIFVATVGLHIGHQLLLGDIFFLSLLLIFLGFVIRRFRQRDDLPPPSFVLVGFGFLNALTGTVLLIINEAREPTATLLLLGNALLYQGFVLNLVLGIGTFLLPRFFQLPQPSFPESRTPTPEWSRHALVAAGAGILLLVSFILEAALMWFRAAGLLRCATVAGFLLMQLPLYRAIPRVTIARCLRISLVLLVLGLAFPGLWPMQRIAGLHLVFIGGFTLITLTVATRVVLGHSGQSHLFTAKLPFLTAATILLICSAILRIVGDFILLARPSILNYASYLWILAAIVWAWRVLPSVRVAGEE